MTKWLSVGFAAFLIFGAVLATSAAAKDAATIELNEGVLAAVRPDLDTSTVELSFQDVTNGSVHIQLSSPETKFF